ncbi:MAG: hypothetical protein V3R81_06575 [Gammaproteobacteria bacterium]
MSEPTDELTEAIEAGIANLKERLMEEPTADTFSNAPLALLQQRMAGGIVQLEWVLRLIEEAAQGEAL